MGVQGAVSTLHTRYRNLTVSLVLDSAATPVDWQRERSGAQSEIGEHALRLNETCYTCQGKLIEQSAERSFSYAF